MTKTERLTRLRQLAREARVFEHLPKTCRVEVGSRTTTVQSDTFPAEGYLAEDDDLSDFLDFEYAAADEEVTGAGCVVHLYLSTRYGREWELYSVVCGWIGTDTEPARLINIDGKAI